MTCPKCKSENVNVQIVSETKSRGGTIPWWYWLCFVWIIDLCLYLCIIGFFGVNIHHIFRKTKSKTKSYVVCQNCGHKWKV